MLGGILPPNEYETIIKNSKGVVQYAADALQKSILCGLRSCEDNVSLINLPFISSFPLRYKSLYIRSYDFLFNTVWGTIESQNVGFCNLSVYKMLSRYINARKALQKHINEITSQEQICILCYCINVPLMLACAKIKQNRPNVKLVVIAPDLPEFMSQQRNVLKDAYKYCQQKKLNKIYKSVDGWVLLSKHMSERLPTKENNWIVMEGIFNKVADEIHSNESKSAERYIMYAGTLAQRYGIQSLVRAFHNSKLTDVNLCICGAGDSKSMIEKYASLDSRIKYLGQLKREDVLALQKHATLLVNPRTPEGEFTKYSFPSKTMEYLASGVPTLMYKLPGVPEEYFEHCYVVEELGEHVLTQTLESVLSKDSAELKRKGEKARQFILEYKNPEIQMRKVIEFIKTL